MMLRKLASAECMPAPSSETVGLLIECFRPFADTQSVRWHHILARILTSFPPAPALLIPHRMTARIFMRVVF
jgi:hypothetical protein